MPKQNIPLSTDRVNKLRKEAKSKGWKRRDYYATPSEHKDLKAKLIRMRDKGQANDIT